MADDPWAAFADAPAPAAAAPAAPAPAAAPGDADPYAAFADAPQAAAAAHADASTVGPVDHGATTSGMLGFLDGVPFAGPSLVSGAQKAGAAIATLRDGGTYADHLAKVQASSQATADAHPWAHTAGELAGGIVGTAPAVAAAPEAFGLGGGTLATRMAAGAASGAAIGAGDGAVRSNAPTVGGKLADAGIGAIGGGLAGGAAPGIGAAAGAVGRSLFGTAVRDTAEVPQSVRAEVMRAMNQDAPLDPLGRVDQLGPHAMLADGGPSLQGIAMGQAAKDGAGAPIVLDALRSRDAGASDRILGDLSSAIGPAQNADAVGRQIADVGQASTQPYFQRAYQAGVPQGPDLGELTQRPAVASAIQDAATAAANRGTPFPTVTLDAAGNPVASDAALQAYEAGQRPAVTGALANLLGADPAMGPLAAQDALAAQRKAASDPLYAAYREMSVPMTSDLADVLNRPSVKAALSAAERKAQDQGRSIFAPRASQFEREPLGSGGTREAPLDLNAIPPFQAEQATSRPGPVGAPRPVDLHQFVRSLGGIQDPGGDLASMGLQSIIARPGQGLGPDAVRQVAAEAGYLGGDTTAAMKNTTIGDLHNALENGDRTFSVHDEEALHAWAARDAAMADFNRGGVQTGQVGQPAGPRPMAPGMPFGGPDAPAGPAARAPQITPEGLDYVKRALQDKADTARRTGLNDDARIFGSLKDDLLGAIENHPDPSIADAYGAARRAYAGPSREMDALNAGRASFADNVTPEQVQREYAALGTDGERQQYRNGMFSAGRDKMSKAGDTRNFVDMVAGNDAIRAKFGAVAPHQGAIDHFNAAMDRARQTFTEAQRPTMQGLHGALDQLDARAPHDPAVAAARDAMAARLAQNPDFARGRALQADYGNPAIPGSGTLLQALDAGRTALRGGPSAIHPEDYASSFASRSPAAQQAQRAGLNSEIYRQLGERPNDLVALKSVVKGDNDRSRSILGTTFGQQAADTLAGTADRETTFAGNYNDVLRNSMTARRTEAIAGQKAAAPEPFQIGHVHNLTWEGIGATAAKLPINALLRAMQPVADTAAHDAALSRVVTATGEERRRLLVQILQSQAAEDANGRLADGTARVGSALSALSGPALARLLLEHRQSSPAR